MFSDEPAAALRVGDEEDEADGAWRACWFFVDQCFTRVIILSAPV